MDFRRPEIAFGNKQRGVSRGANASGYGELPGLDRTDDLRKRHANQASGFRCGKEPARRDACGEDGW
jgi:hypothetical protein